MRTRVNFLTHEFRTRPRLWISILAGATVALLLPSWMTSHDVTRGIVGWNITTFTYLILSSLMMRGSSDEQIHRRAREQDDGKLVVLSLAIIASIVSLIAVVVQLGVIKDMRGTLKYAHIVITATTIISSWAFIHLIFALHYAHDFYTARAKDLPGGLDFPKDQNPIYGDFVYFAFVIGTSGQTADVSFTSKSMRRVGLVHCVLTFVYNTTVLALTINIAANLIELT